MPLFYMLGVWACFVGGLGFTDCLLVYLVGDRLCDLLFVCCAGFGFCGAFGSLIVDCAGYCCLCYFSL